MKREQRAAGWVQAQNIVRSVTPEMLVERERLLGSLLFRSRRFRRLSP
jgi:phosphoribosyl-dephospho-CoA transferase